MICREKLSRIFGTNLISSLFIIQIFFSSYTVDNMKVWWWDEGVCLKCDRLHPDFHKLQPEELLDHIHRPV